MNLLNQATNAFFHWFHPPTRSLNFVRQALSQQDLDLAAERIEQARQKYPDRPDVNQLYVNIHSTRQDWDKVRSGIERIADNPNSSFQQNIESARLYAKLGEHEKAIDLFERLGNQSRGFDAGLAWNSIARIYMDRSESKNALFAYSETVRRAGPVPWLLVNNVLKACTFESVSQCKAAMLRWPAQDQELFRFHKFLSLLEQKLVADGSCDQKTVIQSMRTASDIVFKDLYRDLNVAAGATPLQPKFLIIGAMKCGTTTLFELISQHPRCVTSFEKELQFFQFPDLSEQWYLEHFPRISPDLGYITGDASPGYYIFDIVDRVKKVLPDVKLIFIERDPARRALSHMRHNARFGMPDYGPDKAISGMDALEQEIESSPENAEQILLDITYGKRKHNAFLALGCYELLLRRWKRAFGPDQLLSLSLEELSQRPQEVMNRVFEFIDLEPFEIEPLELNIGDYKSFDPHAEEMLKRLSHFYARVAELTENQ